MCIGINIVRKIYNQLYFSSVRRIRGNGQFRLVYHVTPSITWNESWSNRFSIQVAVAPLSQRSLQFLGDPSSSFWEYFRRVFCIFYPKTYSRAKIQRPKIQEFWENHLKESRDTKTENFNFGKEQIIWKRETEKRRFQPFFSQLLDLMEENCLKIFIQENFTISPIFFAISDSFLCFEWNFPVWNNRFFHRNSKEDYGNKKRKYSKFIQSIFTQNHIIFAPRNLVNLGLKIRFETRRLGGRP